jgi:hypothetical protein
MSMSPVYIYKCVNITHEPGTACSRPAAEPNGLCKDCSDAEKIGGISHFASGVFQSYPVSNVVSSIYTIGNWAEGLAGNTNVLSYPAQEKVRALQNEIRRLEDSLKTTASELQKEKVSAAGHLERETKLKATLAELEKKQNLAFLLERVSPEAAGVLLDLNSCTLNFLAPKHAPSLQCL